MAPDLGRRECVVWNQRRVWAKESRPESSWGKTWGKPQYFRQERWLRGLTESSRRHGLCLGLDVEDTPRVGDPHRVCAVLGAEFAEHVCNMELHRFYGCADLR